ncbi:hypothetical protein SLE2022_389850 [Rubroshorea leprosula]
MEESLAQGKPLNKEQAELFQSKPIFAACIEELQKLRNPLASAVSEEKIPRPSTSCQFGKQGDLSRPRPRENF